jgi:SRSO17 transposase
MPGVSGNCWALAQAIGYTRLYRLQHLLSGAVWDEDSVRDTVRAFVGRHLGDGGVLIFDETGDLKKSQATAGSGGSTPARPGASRCGLHTASP